MRCFDTLIIAAALSAGLCACGGLAQAQAHPERRVVERTAPVYPELAKRTLISGIVKMEVVVRANGTVKSSKILGGNPVLLESASDAVHKWKFEPAAQETTEVVQILFQPNSH